MAMGPIRRRGLLAGVAALAGAGLARLVGTHTAAANVGDAVTVGSVRGNFQLDNPTTQAVQTGVLNSLPDRLSKRLFESENYSDDSIVPPSNLRIALLGFSAGANSVDPSVKVGVYGAADDSTGVGVWGASTTSGIGVRGLSGNGSGVEGSSTAGDGVRGFSSGNLKYGLAGNGTGQAHGLVGTSANQNGVIGINTAGNNWAGMFINAQANTPNSGRKGLYVQGDFVVLNGTKNAAVKTARFGHRKMYAVEATENVFEDFGTATLKGGKVRVELDEIFAETVNTGQKYQVYLTPASRGSKGLCVATKDAKGFVVEELGDGSGSYDFDYRVVAKVRGHEKTRMEQFEPPPLPQTPQPPTGLQLPTVVKGEKKERP